MQKKPFRLFLFTNFTKLSKGNKFQCMFYPQTINGGCITMENVVEKFINERVMENKALFTEKELNVIRKNSGVVRKIYILAAVNFYKI